MDTFLFIFITHDICMANMYITLFVGNNMQLLLGLGGYICWSWHDVPIQHNHISIDWSNIWIHLHVS